jgi:hypothetical protein
VRLRSLAIALVVPMLVIPVLVACSSDSAAHLRALPRGAHVTQGWDPLVAAADSVRSLFAPVACDTVFLNTGYVAKDPEGAVFRTFACRGGTTAAHGYFFQDPAGRRTLVSGRVFRTASHHGRQAADSIAQDLSTRNGAPTACVSLAWPQSDVARVWAAGNLSIRVVADTETDDVTVERSVGAPDCDPSLFARYPEFPYR